MHTTVELMDSFGLVIRASSRCNADRSSVALHVSHAHTLVMYDRVMLALISSVSTRSFTSFVLPSFDPSLSFVVSSYSMLSMLKNVADFVTPVLTESHFAEVSTKTLHSDVSLTHIAYSC